MRFFISIFFCLCGLSSYAQKYFDMSDDLIEAYHLVTSLKLESGQKKLEAIKIKEPNNALVYYVENYIDFFKIFLGENEKEFLALEDNKDKRLAQIDLGDKSSPYYLFAKAEINLQWAAARSKFDQKLSAAREIYRAYKLLEENQKRFPDFIVNKKSLSIMHAVAESIPGVIRSIAGIEGNVEMGTNEIAELVTYADQNDFIYRDECYAIYAYILFYQNNKRLESYHLLSDGKLNHSKSPLLCFLKANIAQKTGHIQEALKILEERPQGSEYYSLHYLDFMYGKFKLYELDPKANEYMHRFVDNFYGRHYIKEAYQKLAWHALVIKDDINGYKEYMSLCDKKGQDLVDEDKQAQKESDQNRIPDVDLLKARLLFDGGHFEKGKILLEGKAASYQINTPQWVEYQYRLGRFCHELGDLENAISYYKLTISEDNDDYYGCNSALQLGLVYESLRKYATARQYFEVCLSMSPKDYKNSLHQKAKSGIDRIKMYLK